MHAPVQFYVVAQAVGLRNEGKTEMELHEDGCYQIEF